MKVFLSHSRRDAEPVSRIVERLTQDGHTVWIDTDALNAGDNIFEKVEEGLRNAEALVVVLSENSFRSQWVQHEVSTMALQEISSGERRIIPVRLDHSEVPGYLAARVWIDLTENFERGLEQLSAALAKPSSGRAKRPRAGSEVRTDSARTTHIAKLREALRKGRLTLVCGAGVSIQAGIPAWNELLFRLLERMLNRIVVTHALDPSGVAVHKFQERYANSSLILGKYLKNNFGRDFAAELRSSLYASPPATSPIIDSIVKLARPQRDGRPLESIITFNFDSLIEECLTAQSVPNCAIFSEAVTHDSNDLPVYHVHGYLPRVGPLSESLDLVFSEDAYHSQFIDPFSWSNLIQLNKLTLNTCLFVGISLTDPNMRRLLDVAWRKSADKKMAHFIVRRAPRSSNGDVMDQVAKLLDEQDANALGLNVLWIDAFDEIPALLDDLLARA